MNIGLEDTLSATLPVPGCPWKSNGVPRSLTYQRLTVHRALDAFPGVRHSPASARG